MICGKNVSLTLGEKEILYDVSFEIGKQRITLFLGKSGAGKTSLLRCIANLETDYTGTITLDGKSIKTFSDQQRAHHIGFVAQSFNLFPHMTVLQNCMHPMMHVMGIDKPLAEKKAGQVLQSLEMQDYLQNSPQNLSGGQQQRVAIARALCLEPKVLLFDEPTSALDPESTRSLQQLIVELQRSGITIAITSHDMPFVRAILDKAYFLEDGRIIDTYDKQENGDVRDDSRIQNFLKH